jgi:hypothetical protein
LIKHRISTTISQKHWEILSQYTEKYNSQQKVLEHALENLESNPSPSHRLSREEELWDRIGKEIKDTLVIFQKSQAKIILESVDIERYREYIINQKPVEFAIEYYYKKPLKECSLQEIIDAMILNIKIQGSSDSISYTDDGDHYTINITHNLGINSSRLVVMMNESLFKSYGARSESNFSERSIFFKVYKNLK